MSLLVLSSAHILSISSQLPHHDLINLMALVFARLSSCSGMASPHRSSISTPHHNVLFMPSSLAGYGTAIKVVSVPTSSSDTRGLPASTLLIDEQSGVTKAIVNARGLTALRNAAGSALATRIALGPSAAAPEKLAMFGAGAQIEAHINLFLRVFSPSLTECTIFNRSLNTRLDSLVSSLRQAHPSVTFITKPIPSNGLFDEEGESLIRCADIICTATPSLHPLFPGHYVKSGAHINLIGSYTPSMIEIDKELVNRAGLIMVDSKKACLVEAGDLIAAQVHQDRMIELGELVEIPATSAISTARTMNQYTILEEKRRSVRNSGDVTIFKSVGVGVQDVAIANLVVQFAEKNSIGTTIQAYDIR